MKNLLQFMIFWHVADGSSEKNGGYPTFCQKLKIQNKKLKNPACQHFIKNDSQTPPIHSFSVPLAAEDLGCDVVRCAYSGIGELD